MTTAWRERGWSAARALRARERLVAGRPVDVEHLARSFGARVVRGDLDGAMARIIGQGSRAVIRLSPRVLEAGAQRFSIAHELGHLVMRHPTPSPLALAARTVARPVDRGVETEANAFAAELLMPEVEIRARMVHRDLDMELAGGIAGEMGVSVVAAALRCVELTTEPSAVVLVESARVSWIATGGGLRTSYRRGMRIDPGTVAAHLAATDAASCAPAHVPARLWRVRDACEHTVVHEHAVRVPEQAAVLSLVTAPSRRDRAA